MEADQRRELDPEGSFPESKCIEAVAFISIGKTIVGLEIICDGVAVRKWIALIVVIRQILGKLIVHLELEMPLVRAETGSNLLVGIRAGDILLATVQPTGLSARNVIPGRLLSLEQRDVIVAAGCIELAAVATIVACV